MALHPTPQQQIDATTFIETKSIKNFEEIFAFIQEIHQTNPQRYHFHADAVHLLQDMNSTFKVEVNATILDGVTPLKSKKSDLVPHMALSLHIFNQITMLLLNGQQLRQIPTVVSKETFQRALKFVEHLEMRKDVLCQVSDIQRPTSASLIL